MAITVREDESNKGGELYFQPRSPFDTEGSTGDLWLDVSSGVMYENLSGGRKWTVRYTFTGVAPSVPSVIAMHSGNGYSGPVGQPVIPSPKVIVTGPGALPVAGAVVLWTVVSGGGDISASSSPTDVDGIAAAPTWTLGPDSGANELRAQVSGYPALSVMFAATGAPAGGTPSLPTAAAPVITYSDATGLLTITTASSGATIYYTLDGSTPTTSSTVYTAPISGVAVGTTISAKAGGVSWSLSAMAQVVLAESYSIWGPA